MVKCGLIALQSSRSSRSAANSQFFTIAYWRWEGMSIPVFCALLLTALAAGMDLREHRIPNILSLGGWIAGAGLWMGFRGFRGIGVWFLGSLCLGVTGILVWRLGGIGAGDVKLLSALGGMLSWKRGLWVFFAALVLAALFGAVSLWKKGQLTEFWPRLKYSLRRMTGNVIEPEHTKQTQVCFAVMLLGAVLLRALREWWWLH